VAPGGSNTNPGTLAQPWGTIGFALTKLGPGKTLYIRGGTYNEMVKVFNAVDGTQSQPIVVQNYPGERVVIKGQFLIRSMPWWTFSGINVVWNGSGTYQLVILRGGHNWRWTNSEVWNGRGAANILVGDDPDTGEAPNRWRIDNCHVHDNLGSTHLNGDHLIYVNSSTSGGQTGLIERCLLINSPNGRAVKLGPGSAGMHTSVASTEVRYNTMVDNLGPSNVQVSYEASRNNIHHNIMVRSGPTHDPGRRHNVTYHQLTGTNNVAANNLGWQSAGVVQGGDSGLVNGGGNVHADPLFTDSQYHTAAPEAAGKGRWG
jgi:hypothetical protein